MLPPNQSHLAYTLNLYHHVSKTDRIANIVSKIDLSCVYNLCSHFYSSSPWGRIVNTVVPGTEDKRLLRIEPKITS